MGFRFAVWLLVCATLSGLATPVAQAAAAAPTARAAAQDEEAQSAFRAGVDAARQERWTDARVLFEKAYGLSPRPVVLINLAGAQARTGRLTEAAENYRRIVDDHASPETEPIRRAAAEVLPALEARIPRVRLRPSGLSSNDVIQIDGTSFEAEALTQGAALDPGEHTLVVIHVGIERARVLFRLAERELRYITLPLPAVAERSPGAVTPGSPGPGLDLVARPDAGTGPGRPWWKSPLVWTAVAVVVVGASVAGFLLVERRDQQTFSGNIPPGQISVR